MPSSDSALHTVRVAAIQDEAIDVRSFMLKPVSGNSLPRPSPGDHVDVLTPAGIVRQYSLVSWRQGDSYEIAVKREAASRGGSASMHDRLKVGDTLHISAPRSNFVLQPAARYLLVAGGIGITPLLAMAEALCEQGAVASLHYYARSHEHAAYLARIERLEQALSVEVHLGLNAEAVNDSMRDDAWGRPRGTHVYLCGPGPFMEAGRALYGAVLGTDALHLEYFQPRIFEPTDGDRPFRIRLARSERELLVAKEETILEVLAAHGVQVATSCTKGICGTCVARVLDGVPDHRDSFLSDFHRRSNKKVALCVSRAKSDCLVIDL